jgi:hypothetical protein
MATFFLDLVGGNDANNGTTFANRWKTITNGATAARIAPGDLIKIMATPDETLVGNATWTQNSKTVTLAGAVTANITDCESAWTASSNVTSTADTSLFKENTKSAKHVIAGAFTTGLAAYFATGTIDLSGYQQVSFWIYNNLAIAASTISLRLCSDVAGVTTLHTIAIPAIPSTGQWVPITVDLGSNMNSAVKSVALYCDLDPGALTVQFDNIIACKASSSADSLSLTSLIGKVWNRVWVASTTYSVGDIRKPTQPNRNGFRYKVTAQTGASGSSEPTWPAGAGCSVTDGGVTWICEGPEDTYYALQSINGTTVKLDNANNTQGNSGQGYGGATETVATYKRETFKLDMTTGTGSVINQFNDSGTQGVNIVYSGGWDTTAMTTQTGETWMDAQNGYGQIIRFSNSYNEIRNLNGVRGYAAFYEPATGCCAYNCHFNACGAWFYVSGASPVFNAVGVVGNNCSSPWQISNPTTVNVARGSFDNSSATSLNMGAYRCVHRFSDVTLRNNFGYGFQNSGPGSFYGNNIVFGNNISGSVGSIDSYATYFHNCLFPESTEFAGLSNRDQYIYSDKHDQTAGLCLITTDGGTIITATDQRHTGSGVSWKFRPTSTTRHIGYPLRLSVAKIACTSGVAVSVSIWTRRDNTNIVGQLVLEGGQLAGVPESIVSCAPSINTWTQSSTISFTPTETGVIEVSFRCYDGVGTSNNFWIDDLVVS